MQHDPDLDGLRRGEPPDAALGLMQRAVAPLEGADDKVGTLIEAVPLSALDAHEHDAGIAPLEAVGLGDVHICADAAINAGERDARLAQPLGEQGGLMHKGRDDDGLLAAAEAITDEPKDGDGLGIEIGLAHLAGVIDGGRCPADTTEAGALDAGNGEHVALELGDVVLPIEPEAIEPSLLLAHRHADINNLAAVEVGVAIFLADVGHVGREQLEETGR